MSSDILDWVTADGSSGYKAEKGRYHLYVCYGCPFAHRAITARRLKGLEDVISMDAVDYILNKETGWKFSPEKDNCDPDTVNGKEYLKEVYLLSHPEYAGRITVPVLFDKQTKKIVSNSSSDIVRMFSSEFNEFCASPEQAAIDLYPEDKKAEIDELNGWIGSDIVSGVYKVNAGKGESQEKYEEAVTTLFDALDKVEEILSRKRFLTGDEITEADIKLFCPLARFDSVYYIHYWCTKAPLTSYKNIWPYVRDICQQYGVIDTINIHHMKGLYYGEGVLPVGPVLNFSEPSGRK